MLRFLASLASLLALSTVVAATADARQFAQPPHPAQPDRAALRAKLAEARAANLASFVAYEHARVYPSNTTSAAQLNVWRDAGGHLCAAATIIDHSGAPGAHELVQHVGDTDNHLRLATVHDGALMTWMLESGLTQEELALIQRPFSPVVQKPRPEPQPVDADLRAKETARLAALYQQIEQRLDREAPAALDTATERLLAHPELAAAVLR